MGNTDTTGGIVCEDSRETPLQAGDDLQPMETRLHYAEDEGKEPASPRRHSRQRLKDMCPVFEAAIEPRKS